jgi:NAD(P)-dependent dehydrogenase (short-subunit alcohol dehydrogenase family)
MTGKNFLIVGGSSGIGLGLVNELLKENNVIAYSRSGEQPLGNSNAEYRALDVLADEIELGELPPVVDGIVYCPGTIDLKPFRRLSEADFINDFKINVTGAVKVLQKVYSALRKSDQAAIVMFSTVAVGSGMNFHSSIASAKGAVEGLVRSLAAEFAPKIRVNAVAPSLTDTPLAANLLSNDAKREASAGRHPLMRVGNIEDQVNAALFLLSPKTSWMTGQILHVDGGMSSIR